MRPRIGISACLLDEETRSGGDRARCRFLVDELGAHVDWAPYAADVETGLGALWETWRLTGQNGLIDHGGVFPAINGLPNPAALDGYIVRGDPHGAGDGPWYAADGRNAFARRLGTAFPLLPLTGESALARDLPHARFVERVFARARLREVFADGWRTRDLVAFHTRHKLQILAHSPARYQQAGRVVAAAGCRSPGETEADYRRIFTEALADDATRGRAANAMHRVYRMIGKGLDDGPRHDVLDRIQAYQRGELPFDTVIRLLASHATGEPLRWASEQTYLNPFPDALRRHLLTADGAASLATP
ncbi:DUF1722 domain-containing protein [Actinomadura sp. DC4]|uniref:YbgA family protein n=1 Tax=Actinomadura sp. DC4 TaxID=3055069 RepID=UPI0025B2356C|nr:DUF1722 domain-containing protein [Actinomadura sp. DC4]MDN3354078.1 DUF1722 domain-containing protein [Actinomadura sp. DC4]